MITAKSTLRRQNKAKRIERVGKLARGKFVNPDKVPEILRRIIEPGDVLCIEGDNQKQADFLANQLATLDKKDLRDIHLVMSCITLPAHIELFKKGMIRQVDFCYAGPQGTAVADLVKAKKFPVGAIHTYNELFGRFYVDLTPRVALVAATPPRPTARATCTLPRTPRTRPQSSSRPPSRMASYSRR